jgi:hypothetical protein
MLNFPYQVDNNYHDNQCSKITFNIEKYIIIKLMLTCSEVFILNLLVLKFYHSTVVLSPMGFNINLFDNELRK